MLFDNLIRAGEQRGRYGQTERFRRLEIYNQVKLGRFLYQ